MHFGVSNSCVSWTPLSKGVKGLTPLRGATPTPEGEAAVPPVVYLWHPYCGLLKNKYD